MNKSELIDAVAASADLPKASAGRAIDAMIDTITASLQKDDPVVLVEAVPLLLKIELQELDVIRKLGRQSKLRPRECQVSRLVKH